ncbi:YkgJ family cysteine cluster protein [Brevundimonas sp.]|uniref:YkgJ family cysteine cluster protein n=1 Tax=Brevundimonas sp. TaxID=1871086 RepID=UPI002ABADA0F|nr:YkgJ family cysteine cluster protein [Brevundimonas sp.]MDZ4364155.1 YkgJ family cysteine cluster protein [Brevundimonas sp.]
MPDPRTGRTGRRQPDLASGGRHPASELTLSAPSDPVARLAAPPVDGGAVTTGRVTLDIGGERIPVEMTVPAGPVCVEDVLPVLQGLSSLFATRATARTEQLGKAVSCRAGCGACCRQLVPIAPAEARTLARMVETLPEPRRTEILRRFEEALATLNGLGILDRLDQDPNSRRAVAIDYFRAGVACPFLEDEACSIHADRPMSCREYLVTSPPEHCADLSHGVETLKLEAQPSVALLQADLRDGWTPLILALVQDAQAPASSRDRDAATILKAVIGAL